MPKQSIVDQIKATQDKIEKIKEEQKQKRHQLAKLQSRERAEQQRLRTHRLIEKGAIIESMHPVMKAISPEQLQPFLQQVFSDKRTLLLLHDLEQTQETQNLP